MAPASVNVDSRSRTDGTALVDPRAPRFGQALTALGLALGIVLGQPLLVFAVAAVLVVAVVTNWRYDLYATLWRQVALQFVDRPAQREPAAPHRFAKLLGATFTTVASLLLLVGFDAGGYAVAGLVALLAAVAAVLDICVGCRMYKQVSFVRKLGLV